MPSPLPKAASSFAPAGRIDAVATLACIPLKLDLSVPTPTQSDATRETIAPKGIPVASRSCQGKSVTL